MPTNLAHHLTAVDRESRIDSQAEVMRLFKILIDANTRSRMKVKRIGLQEALCLA